MAIVQLFLGIALLATLKENFKLFYGTIYKQILSIDLVLVASLLIRALVNLVNLHDEWSFHEKFQRSI